MKLLSSLTMGAVLLAGGVAPTAFGQTAESPPTAPDETTLTGTLVSAAKNTVVVRTKANTHQLFVLDRYTVKPDTLDTGSEVTVRSTPTGEPGVRLARVITLGSEAQTGTNQPSGQPPPIPAETRRLQNEIERETRPLAIGARLGIGMNPEVLIVGVGARMGPLFHRDIHFRPSAEFGFGEVTKFFNINADVSYRLPLTPRWSNWSTFLGAGPAFGFSQQNFNKGSSGIDWSNLSFTPGLNVIAGLESRRGFVMEFRSTVYASPNPIFRIMFGYYF